MVKYKDYYVVFEEMPDMVSLAINITNCPHRCKNCHSPELRENIGKELTNEELDDIIKKNDGINCVILMGDGNDIDGLIRIAQHIDNNYPNIASAIYSGNEEVDDEIYRWFDYVKIGPYIEKFGPLNMETTNQRLYKVIKKEDDLNGLQIYKEDITYKFWKRQ